MSEAFNVDEFLGGTTVARLQFKDRTVLHHFREIDSKTDLEYQRRLNKIRVPAQGRKPSEYVPGDDILLTEVWLYDQLVEKVEIEIVEDLPPAEGNFPARRVTSIPVEDFKSKISPAHKRQAALVYQMRFRQAPEADEKNS